MREGLEKLGVPPALIDGLLAEREAPRTDYASGGGALTLVVLPQSWGPLDGETVAQLRGKALFLCGVCSRGEADVYHNLFGEHRHVSADRLLKALEVMEREQEDAESHRLG